MKILSFRDANGESFGVFDVDRGLVDVGRKCVHKSLREALIAGAMDEIAAIANNNEADYFFCYSFMNYKTILPYT